MAAEPPERKRNVPDDERKHRDTYKELVSKLNVDNDAERAEARAAMLQFIHQADIGLYYPVVIHIYHTFGLDEDRKKSVYDWTPETFSRIRGRLETSMKMLVQAMPYYESGFYEVSEFKSMVEFYQCEIARLNLLENVVKKEAAYQKACAPRPHEDNQARLRRIYAYMQNLTRKDPELKKGKLSKRFPPEYIARAHLQLSLMQREESLGPDTSAFLKDAKDHINEAVDYIREAHRRCVLDRRESDRLDYLQEWKRIAKREWRTRFREHFGDGYDYGNENVFHWPKKI